MSKPNVKSSRRNNRRKKRGVGRRGESMLENLTMAAPIPKGLMGSSAFPSAMKRKLLFRFQSVLNGAVDHITQDFRLNGAFSPDGVGSCTGFAQLAAIYNFYKVINNRFRFNVVSNEQAVPVFFGCICRDAQPSTSITTWAIASNSLELAPTTGPLLVGEATGASVYRSRWYAIHPAVPVGNALEYYGYGVYSSTVASNPAQLTWVSFVLNSVAAGTNLTNGCFLDFYLEFTTEFYSPKNLAA
jgi:hypothetical protein